MQGTAKSHEELLGSPTNARIWEFAKGVKTEIVVKKNNNLTASSSPAGPEAPTAPTTAVCLSWRCWSQASFLLRVPGHGGYVMTLKPWCCPRFPLCELSPLISDSSE